MKMTTALLVLCALSLGAPMALAQDAAEPSPPSSLDTDTKKLSYSLGYHFADYLERGTLEVDVETIIQGFRDSMAQKPLLLTPEDITNRVQQFHYSMIDKARQAQEEEALANIAAEQEFLQKNMAETGVVQLPSGLQYRVITDGAGRTPTETSTVQINYVGKLIDGTEFINTFKDGRPREWQVNKMLKGWVEALPLMKEGSRWELFIPSSLGFGARGFLPKIPPSSCVIYEVELLRVLDEASPEAATMPESTPTPAPGGTGDVEGELEAETSGPATP